MTVAVIHEMSQTLGHRLIAVFVIPATFVVSKDVPITADFPFEQYRQRETQKFLLVLRISSF